MHVCNHRSEGGVSMNEIDEINDMIKESEGKIPKQKLGKKGKIIVTATLVVVGILIGSYAAITLTAQSAEKYWRPERDFTLPIIDWNWVNSSYITSRTNTGTEYILNTTLGNKHQTNGCSIILLINIIRYMAHKDGTGYLDLNVYIYSRNERNDDYQIKSLEFKFDYGNDTNVSYLSLTWSKIASKNLYFDITPSKYSGPWGTYNNKLDYEWMNNYRITGVNKDGKNIKEAGFSFPMRLLFFDKYPYWYNHTITFTAILEYGKYVNGLFGSHWEDVHKLSASAIIYIVPEGGV